MWDQSGDHVSFAHLPQTSWDLGPFGATWEQLGPSGPIYLEAPGTIWDHLGSFGIIQAWHWPLMEWKRQGHAQGLFVEAVLRPFRNDFLAKAGQEVHTGVQKHKRDSTAATE